MHPGPRIAYGATRVLAEDAATNNIGSVTVLHERVRVQAESEEGRPDSLPFAELVHAGAFRTHLPVSGVSRAK
jgi:hypothetical protein